MPSGKQNKRWSEKDEEELKRFYPSIPNRDLAKHTGRSRAALTSRAKALGIRKSPTFLEGMGRDNVKVRWSAAGGDEPPEAA